MLPELREALDVQIRDYQLLHDSMALPPGKPQAIRNLCISAFEARKEALEAANKFWEDEYSDCTFLSAALKNGWLVSDINWLLSLNAAVRSYQEKWQNRIDGDKIIQQIMNTKADTMEKRWEFLKNIQGYIEFCEPKTDELKELDKNFEGQFGSKVIYATEYPEDKFFDGFPIVDNAVAQATYRKILLDKDKAIALKEERKRQAREKSDYVFRELNNMEEVDYGTFYIPNDGQLHNDIKKSNREVIKQIFGEEVYDEIDDMHKGTLKERTVPLIHSIGTKNQKKGHDVLEMEFAGSGAQDVLKFHKNRKGIIDTHFLTPEEQDERYGKKVQKGKDKFFDYIRTSEKTIKTEDGRDVEKKRYFFAGATPNWGLVAGLFNLGDNSIESTRAYARNFASEFISKHFEKWLSGDEIPHDIDISIEGHSRGAVAAGQAVKLIHEWVKKYCETHEDAKDFMKYIHYDLRLQDPVPGFLTNLRLGSCNLRDIPNLNTTVICSMAQDHTDMLFPLQHVKGARKIVLTTTDHLMDIWKEDKSQMGIIGDGSNHRQGYYDAETGEMYRGSGMSEMPDGVYISDEKHNLVRVTSYSQLSKIFGTLYGNVSPQRTRSNNIHYMVRDWFVENDLEMSFVDSKEREEATAKNMITEERIIESTNKRIKPVREQVMRLKEMRDMDASKEDLIAEQKKMIKLCKAYMKKTSIPASGDSEYRMDLVSDLLTFTMRETNQLEKELTAEKGIERDNTLDERIAKHREKMMNKDGFVSRKLYDEKLRLKKEEGILSLAKGTATICDAKLKELAKTRIGKSTSSEYDAMVKALKEGKKLGEGSTVKEIIDFHKKLAKVCDKYDSTHDRLIGPRTDDGKTRLNIARELSKRGKDVGKEIEEKAIYFGDKNVPIGDRIIKRKETVQVLDEKYKTDTAEYKENRKKIVETAKKNIEKKNEEKKKKPKTL